MKLIMKYVLRRIKISYCVYAIVWVYYCGIAKPLSDTSVISYCNVAFGGIPLLGIPVEPYAKAIQNQSSRGKY